LVQLALAACASIERIVTDVAVASIRFAEFDLGRVIRAVVASAAVRGAIVDVSTPPGQLAIVGDPARIGQALDNLIGNAVVHGESATPIRVTATSDASTVRVSVTDGGVGISEDDQKRIFDKGVSLRAGRERSGIGLTLTRAIVDGHGGSLAVESEPGRGTTFTMVLPARR
jgi:signal transduction histidine kinase